MKHIVILLSISLLCSCGIGIRCESGACTAIEGAQVIADIYGKDPDDIICNSQEKLNGCKQPEPNRFSAE